MGLFYLAFKITFCSLVDNIGNYEDILKKDFPKAKIIEVEHKIDKIKKILGNIQFFQGINRIENLFLKKVREFLKF